MSARRAAERKEPALEKATKLRGERQRLYTTDYPELALAARQLDRLETSLGRMDDAGEAMPVEQRIRTLRSMTSAAELLRDARRRHAGASLPPESAANSSPDRPTGSDAQFEAARERELEAARAAREKADAHMREAEEALSLMKRCTFRF